MTTFVVQNKKAIIRVGWLFVILLGLIGIGAATSRYVLPSQTYFWFTTTFYGPDFTNYQIPRYEQHGFLTLLHVLPGTLFMIIGPLQFLPGIRNSHLRVHRWLGRTYLVSGLILCLSALSILFVFPFAGLNESIPTAFFGVIFLVSLAKAYYHIRRREIRQHREWMIRAFAIGLGIASIRIVFDIFRVFTTAQTYENFGVSFWAGWGITLVLAEIWINVSRSVQPMYNATGVLLDSTIDDNPGEQVVDAGGGAVISGR